jgi:predicted nucleotidyltransferase
MKIATDSKLIAQTKTVPVIVDNQLREVLANFPELILALVFGSVALERERPDSDLTLR